MKEGWHKDPQNPGQERWWDGQSWTDRTRASKGESIRQAGKRSSEQDLRPRRRRQKQGMGEEPVREQTPEGPTEAEPKPPTFSPRIARPAPSNTEPEETLEENLEENLEESAPGSPSFVELPSAPKEIGDERDWLLEEEEKPQRKSRRGRRGKAQEEPEFAEFEDLEAISGHSSTLDAFEDTTPKDIVPPEITPEENDFEEDEPEPSRRRSPKQSRSRQKGVRRKPRKEKPRKEKPRKEKSRKEKPRKEKPRKEKPRKEKPRKEKPRKEKPRKEKPRKEKPRPPRKKKLRAKRARQGESVSLMQKLGQAPAKLGSLFSASAPSSTTRTALKKMLPIGVGLVLVVALAAVLPGMLEGDPAPKKTLQNRLESQLAEKRKEARDPYPGVERCIREDSSVNSVLLRPNENDEPEWKIIFIDQNKNYQLISVVRKASPAEAQQASQLSESTFITSAVGPYYILGPIKGAALPSNKEISAYVAELGSCLAQL